MKKLYKEYGNNKYVGVMNVNLKPKVGILFVTSGWFRQVGLQKGSSSITKEVEKIAKEIVTEISQFAEIIYRGVIFSEYDSENFAKEIKANNIDCIIISTLMWCEDSIIRAALKMLSKLPIIVCTFFPYKSLPQHMSFYDVLKGSGSVGSLQISGFLRREEYKYKTITGYYLDGNLYKEIKKHCISIAIKKYLKNVKCGVLPFRCDQMSTTYVDEFSLRKLYGVELKYLELKRFYNEAQKVSKKEIKKYRNIIKSKGYFIEVNENNLIEGIKYAICIEKIVKQENLSIIAMNDVCDEMHECFGLRPCLTNPRISDLGVVISMEAEIAAGVAMYILHLFTKEVPFYTEILSADIKKNVFLMGHAGYHDSINHDKEFPVKIISDVEYENSDTFTGACIYFKYKPGPVTLINSVYDGEKLRWFIVEGISLPGSPAMDGYCHLLCKIKVKIENFYREAIQAGVSQHWIVIPGHVMQDLILICYWLDIKCIVLDSDIKSRK